MDPDVNPREHAPGTPPDPPAGLSGPDGMLVLGGPAPAPPPPPPPGPTCGECDGRYGADGYCGTCGGAKPEPRHHVEAAPAPWVAGVCDRGIRHHDNEDAMAVAADGRRAALVVCDGVSTARRASAASQAAADAALAVLDSAHSRGLGVRSAVAGALSARLGVAVDAAADAVAEVTRSSADEAGSGGSNPSCTIVAAVVEDDVAVVGSVGDSRAYWLPEVGQPRRLTVDDSWAEEEIRLGVPREQAENGPQAHTITRWIGVDAPDHTPATTLLRPEGPGWLVVCSDGLWNYASEPERLAEVVAEVGRAAAPTPEPDPLPLARALVDWANAQGGRDNITVVLARLGRPTPGEPPAATGGHHPLESSEPTEPLGAQQAQAAADPHPPTA